MTRVERYILACDPRGDPEDPEQVILCETEFEVQEAIRKLKPDPDPYIHIKVVRDTAGGSD